MPSSRWVIRSTTMAQSCSGSWRELKIKLSVEPFSRKILIWQSMLIMFCMGIELSGIEISFVSRFEILILHFLSFNWSHNGVGQGISMSNWIFMLINCCNNVGERIEIETWISGFGKSAGLGRIMLDSNTILPRFDTKTNFGAVCRSLRITAH